MHALLAAAALLLLFASAMLASAAAATPRCRYVALIYAAMLLLRAIMRRHYAMLRLLPLAAYAICHCLRRHDAISRQRVFDAVAIDVTTAPLFIDAATTLRCRYAFLRRCCCSLPRCHDVT